MTQRIKYSIRPGKDVIPLKPILPFADALSNLSPHSPAFFDMENQQFLSDWIDPTALSDENAESKSSGDTITAIMGNLLIGLPKSIKIPLDGIEISRIDNIPIHFLEDVPGSKIAHIHKSPSNSELIVFCQAFENHQVGDFIYRLGKPEINPNGELLTSETFNYSLLTKNRKQLTLQLLIQFSEEELETEFLDLGVIQEEELMTHPLVKTRGILPKIFPMEFDKQQETNNSGYVFLPIEQQYSLKALHLTAQNQPLQYELSDDRKELYGKQTQTNQTIFSAKLADKGLYDFELHHSIDRPTHANMLAHNFKRTHSSLYQDIETKEGKIYELSFYFKPIQALQINQFATVELWWAGIMIGVIQLLSETLKGYHFSLEGQQDLSRLEFKLPSDTVLDTQQLANHLDMATIAPEEQAQIKLELGFEDTQGQALQFPITLNLEHEVVVSQAAPYLITMDDLSPYKKIVLAEQFVLHDSPIATLNIEKIFDQLQIPESHRHVDIEQLANSNIYEIKISDSSDKLGMPITVADVELKFDGGNAGLETLFKYLTIDV